MVSSTPRTAADRSAAGTLSRLGLGALAVTAALTLSACGGPDSVGEAWDSAREQLAEAESFRLTAELPEEALQGGATSGTLEASGSTGEPNGQLTMRMKADQGDFSMEVREVGEKGYIRMDVDGEDLDQNAKAMMGLGDKWIAQDVPEDQRGMIGSLRESMLAKLPDAGALEGVDAEAQEVDRDGEKAYRYEIPQDIAESAAQEAETEGEDSDGLDQGAAALNELDMSLVHAFVVDGDGELLALELRGEEGEDGEKAPATEMTFSGWDSVEEVEAPAEDEVREAPGIDGQG